MEVFVTGAGGYIGGAVARRLLADGHGVRGLTRTANGAATLAAAGIAPVIGSLDDAPVLAEAARRADAVVNAADSDHEGAAVALVAALAGTGKPLIHTSGASVVADLAGGEPSGRILFDDEPFTPLPAKAARAAIDRAVLAAAAHGVRSVVLCNSLIYGTGHRPGVESVQLPALLRQARRDGVVRHVGRGLNIWSNVHIDDVADLYALAVQRATPGLFVFVENGEASFRDLAQASADGLGWPGPEPWPVADAVAALGAQRALYSLGSNCRVRSRRSREVLGFRPGVARVLDWIRQDWLAPA